MSIVGKVSLLTGYTLVYAAVVGNRYGGAFAKDPWLALTTDAYTLETAEGTTNSNTGGVGGPTPQQTQQNVKQQEQQHHYPPPTGPVH